MKIIVNLIFLGVWMGFIYLVVTQILSPCLRGTYLFPMFRKNIQDMDQALHNIRNKEYERDLEVNLREEKKRYEEGPVKKEIIDVK